MGAGGAGGATPVGCDWDTASLPFPITLHPGPYFYGGIAFDASCDLLVAGGVEAELYRVDRATGAVTTAASGFPNGSEVHGVVHRQTDGEIYVSASAVDLTPSLYRVAAGTAVLVFDLPARLTDIAVIPAGFGTFAGLIAGSGADGKVYAVDPAVPSATAIGTTTGPLADLAFAPDGSVVYVARTDSNAIEAMTAAGVFSPVATGLSAVDGIAMHPSGNLLYAAHWMGSSVLSAVSLPDGTVTFYASAQVDLGYSTTGLVVDADGDLLVKSWIASQAVLLAP
jgi:sugar lactone lactonase YvrE